MRYTDAISIAIGINFIELLEEKLKFVN
ncbi:MAG: hypothetical protein ACD_12C00090G0001, partial [uncultured bacterium]